MALDYNKFKSALAQTESGNKPGAKNPHSSAKGLYQFTDMWDKFSKKHTGKTTAELLPADDTEAELSRSRADQDKLFKAYYEKEIAPQVARIKKLDKEGQYSEDQIGLMIHFLGSSAAAKYVKTGEDPKQTAPGNKYGNPTMEKYLNKWDKVYAKAKAGQPQTDAEIEADFMAQRGEFTPKPKRKGTADLDVRGLLAGMETPDEDTMRGIVEREESEYVVQPGDTLSKIAKRKGLDWKELARINDLEDPNKIQPGQKLALGDEVSDYKPQMRDWGGLDFDPDQELSDLLKGMGREEAVPAMPEPQYDPYLGPINRKNRRRLS